jgi:prefoldin beta subunit
MDSETETQIKELQALEQNLQSLLMQRQAFEMELGETENALIELNKSTEDVYKIVGNIMIKYSKENLSKDLKQKKDLLALRLKSIDTQQKGIEATAESKRKIVLSKIQKN